MYLSTWIIWIRHVVTIPSAEPIIANEPQKTIVSGNSIIASTLQYNQHSHITQQHHLLARNTSMQIFRCTKCRQNLSMRHPIFELFEMCLKTSSKISLALENEGLICVKLLTNLIIDLSTQNLKMPSKLQRESRPSNSQSDENLTSNLRENDATHHAFIFASHPQTKRGVYS